MSEPTPGVSSSDGITRNPDTGAAIPNCGAPPCIEWGCQKEADWHRGECPLSPEPGACGDPKCDVLHADPAKPIHPPDYIDSRTSGRVSSPEDARVAAARYAVTDPVDRELAEGRGVDLDVVLGLLAAYDEVGRCGGVMPRLLDDALMFCRLPHGHAGWHKCDDGAEWSEGEAP